MKTIVGISPTFEQPGFAKTNIEPAFVGALEWVKGSENTAAGMISVDWQRKATWIELTVTIPNGIDAEVRLPGGRIEALSKGGLYSFVVTA
jgi:alpha-L-rhamnosidase